MNSPFHTMPPNHQTAPRLPWSYLSSVMAHEIGNPLTSLEGLLSLVKDKHNPMYEVLRSELKRLEYIVMEFQTLSNQLEQPTQVVAVESVLWATLLSMPERHDFSYQRHDSSLWVHINGDLLQHAFKLVLYLVTRCRDDKMSKKTSITLEENGPYVIIHIGPTSQTADQHFTSQFRLQFELLIATAIVESFGGAIRSNVSDQPCAIEIALPIIST